MSEAKGACGTAEQVSKLHGLVHDLIPALLQHQTKRWMNFASSEGRQDVLWIACDPAFEQTDIYIVLCESRGFPHVVRTKES